MASESDRDPFKKARGKTAAPAAGAELGDVPQLPLGGTPGRGITTLTPIHELSTFIENPRKGDVDTIVASLRAHTQYKPVTGNIGTHTGRPLEILAGNHTLMAFRDLAETYPHDPQWQAMLVHWVDVDDDQAKRIVAVDNRSSELGGIDNDTLYSLLSGVTDLEGTGYDQDYMDMLAELVAGPPSLDTLADEHGEPKDGDANDSVRLRLAPDVSRRWTAHRANYEDDTLALAAVLDAYEDQGQ